MSENNRIALCASLLATIFKSNRELLLELQFKSAIGRYRKEHPVLEKLIIGDNLSIDATSMPDNEEAILGIKALIEAARSIMEIFVGADYAEKKISDPAKEFMEQHQSEIAEYDLPNYFPHMFKADEEKYDIDGLKGEKEIDQLKEVFTSLFLHCIKSESRTRESIEISLNDKRSIKKVSFEGDGIVLNLDQEVSEETALEELSIAFNSLKIPVNDIAPILQQYGSIPEDLGILKKLYGGILSSKVDFGIGVIDKSLHYDLSKDNALLVRGPKDITRDMTTSLFAKRGLESGAGVIFVTSTEAPEEIKRRLRLIGLDVSVYEAEKRLVFVDWYSKNVERVHGVEVNDNIVRCSEGLTNVSVALDTAFGMISDAPAKRAVLDMVSPGIVTVGFDTILDFISAIRAKLRSNECTSLVTVNSRMHTVRELSALQDNFDGVIDIKRHVVDGVITREIGVMGYSGVFDLGYHPMHLDERGIRYGNDGTIRNQNYQSFSDVGMERVTAGIPGLEIITGGGLPKNGTFLLLIPPGMFPSELLVQLANNALKKEYEMLITLSTVSPSDFFKRIRDGGLQPTTFLNKNTLRVVDWYTQRNQRVMGVEDNDGILRASKDIMHLGVAIDQAIKQMDLQTTSLAIVESFSSALRDYDLRTVYLFAQTLRAKLNKNNFTSFVILEKGTQDEMTISAIEEAFDGTIDISERGGNFEIGIMSMRDSHFESGYRKLTKLRSGLAVEVTRTEEVRYEEQDKSTDLEGSMLAMKASLETIRTERSEVEKKALEIERKEDEFKAQLGDMHMRLAVFKQEQQKTERHKEELARVLKVLDDLLEKLPDETIENFAKSDNFKLYEKIMDKYLGDEG